MPVAINILASLLFGASLVLAVRKAHGLYESFVGWPLFVLLGYQAIFVTPAATFLVRFYPQWSLLYWFDPQVSPQLDAWMGPLSAAAVLLNAGAALLGYGLARTGLLRELTWMWTAPLAVATFGIVFLAVGYWRRVLFVGDYDNFWQGHASLLLTSLAGWVGLLVYGGAVALILVLHRRFRPPPVAAK